MKENNSVNIKSSAASCRPLPPVRGTKPLDTDKSNDDMRKLETSPALTKAMETLNELEKQRILEISKTNATSSTEYQNAAKRINSHRRTIEDIWLKSKYGDMTGLERSSVSGTKLVTLRCPSHHNRSYINDRAGTSQRK